MGKTWLDIPSGEGRLMPAAVLTSPVLFDSAGSSAKLKKYILSSF